MMCQRCYQPISAGQSYYRVGAATRTLHLPPGPRHLLCPPREKPREPERREEQGAAHD